ncbi:DUF4175 domain-containing protein [Roseospirillum parvum]|uniref:DUF4175 domain-containing protein n=1 Tax=Roseospirillum parvum TaxID=83401 RepID=UPI000B892B65|nr:DUF4175 family protein [Roseospirillum parvum]
MALVRRIDRTRRALLWERLWRRLFVLPWLLMAIVALAVSGLAGALPGPAHVLLLVAVVALLAWPVARLRGVRTPGLDEAVARLEATDPRRPVSALLDRLTESQATDPLTRALWQAHQERMAEAAVALPAARPAPGVLAADRRGVRVLALLALIVALAWAGPRAGDNLRAFLSPTLVAPPGAATVELWISPPAYTGRPPLRRTAAVPPAGEGPAPEAGESPLEVPAGSQLSLLVTGDVARPRLVLAADDPGRLLPPTENAEGAASHRLEVTLDDPAADRLGLADGPRRLALWRLAVRPDRPPEVAFTAPPEGDSAHRLRLAGRAEDDHGLTQARLILGLAGRTSGPRLAEPTVHPLALPSPPQGAPREVRLGSALDLTAHPWAGLEVTAHLEVSDGAGQVGTSQSVTLILPERPFRHPLAAELIAQRRVLILAPEHTPRVAVRLDALAESALARPERVRQRPGAALALVVAARRLRLEPGRAGRQSVIDLLWDIALDLEEGDLGATRRRLEAAHQALKDALADPHASAEERTARTEALRRALADHLAELAANAPELPQGLAEQLDRAPGVRRLDPSALEEMLNEIERLSRLGAGDAATALLDRLAEQLRGLDGLTRLSPKAEERLTAGASVLADLMALRRDQAALHDETFSVGNRSTPPGAQVARAGRQEHLRHRLGGLLARLGELLGRLPPDLGAAELEMRRATEALAGGDHEGAASAQGRALARLDQGLDALLEAISRTAGGVALPGASRLPGGGEDPLGRPVPDPADGPKVPAPSRQRAEDIVDDLRRRLNEPDRAPTERDYLKRLLPGFR